MLFPPGYPRFLPAFVVSLVFAAASPAVSSACCDAAHHTWYAWQRTWHGPYAPATPLPGYFIPRTAGHHVEPLGGEKMEIGGIVGLEPPGLQRLGRIPNDLEFAVGAPIAPPRQGR